MINRIRSLIAAQKYNEALEIIETQLLSTKDLTKEKDETEYSELLGLRITAKTLGGTTDPVIREMVRKEKFPSEQTYLIDDKYPVTLVEKDLFLFKCDAIINTIHCDRLFNVSDRSATLQIVRELGEDFIRKQLDSKHDFRKGEFVLLQHPNMLSAPISYHILCYEGQKEIDLEALSKGLSAVLRDSEKRGLKTIGSFPLGFGYVAQFPESERNGVAKRIADKVAETIVSFLLAQPRKFPPHIYLNAARSDTFTTLNRAMMSWSTVDRAKLSILQNLESRHRALVEDACTRDTKFIETLERVSYSALGEKTILLLGETGVGKSYLAERIHKLSSRSSGPFTTVNCALTKADNLESYLFGWKKGSFTSSTADNMGKVKSAEGGTLFLDEIGYADKKVQQSLLTFLSTGTYNRYNDHVDISANVRLIFGTNQDLSAQLEEGLFLNDFYERIAQIVFEIPALRNRPDDIPLFVAKILEEINGNEKEVGIEKEAIELLKQYR